MTETRLAAAIKVMEAQGADALLVLGLVNIRYLSGFTGSEGAFLLATGERILICDSRYTLQASEEAACCSVVEYARKLEGIAAIVQERGWKRIAFDAEKTSVATLKALSEALFDVEFLPLTDQLDQLRAVKSPHEIKALEFSAEVASSAFRKLLPSIRQGISERALALELEMTMKRGGADEKAFDFIVASGERGALPHGRPTERLLKAGELVTIDFGALCNGYHSDETVTVALGEPDKKLLEIYRVVKEAHDMALAEVRPGIVCSAADAIARNHIADCGYGNYFGHGLGHGVGLEIHEMPTLSGRSQQALEEGMVITVEPGIYIPGLGGVRIEDMVLVTADGCRALSKVDKELIFV
jgi:Xaa-Pro aminopeptidase